LLSGRLVAAARIGLSGRRKAFGAAAAGLHALSPLAVLGRGYALATRDGLPVLSSLELEPGQAVHVRLAQGGFRARVTQIEEPSHEHEPESDEPPVSEVRS
jgi:exodeoxyribonuclease VII large subunit